jgi:hypothetical protein
MGPFRTIPKDYADWRTSSSSHTIAISKEADAAQSKAAANKELNALAPTANSKLIEKNNDVNKLTKKEIISLLIACYGVSEDTNKKRKVDVVSNAANIL